MKKQLILASLVVWLMGVSFWCERYVCGILSAKNISPGYESTWQFQVWMFVFFRLLIALLFLAVLLFAECKMFNKMNQ